MLVGPGRKYAGVIDPGVAIASLVHEVQDFNDHIPVIPAVIVCMPENGIQILFVEPPVEFVSCHKHSKKWSHPQDLNP